MSNEVVTVTLSRDEALVFFEWLASRDNEQSPSDSVPAEELVFWHIEAKLEKSLTEIFDPNYTRLLKLARNAIVERHRGSL
ncbi:hypothetical protein K2Y11_20990 [bacterium]|nr:hypothetical protein [bacterium]